MVYLKIPQIETFRIKNNHELESELCYEQKVQIFSLCEGAFGGITLEVSFEHPLTSGRNSYKKSRPLPSNFSLLYTPHTVLQTPALPRKPDRVPFHRRVAF